MNPRNIWQKTYTQTGYRILLHCLFWLFLLALTGGIKMYQIQVGLIGIAVSASAYYSLAYFIAPLYSKRRLSIAIPLTVIYLIFISMMVLLFYQLLVSEYLSFMTSHGVREAVESQSLKSSNLDNSSDVWYLLSLLYLVIIGPPLAAKAFRQIYSEQTKALTLEKENIQLELNFLKSQVNPHLLFNNLNNIQSFIVNNEPEKSVNLIGKLSDLMRFSLYESGKDLIPLGKELEMIESYITLERVRSEDRTAIEFKVTGEGDGYFIPPYLLLPFIENAFKHGVIPSILKSFVNINVKIVGGSLVFTIENSHDATTRSSEPHVGLGLNNIRRRLKFYFKDNYNLQITKEKQLFRVKLEIRNLKIANQNGC